MIIWKQDNGGSRSHLPACRKANNARLFCARFLRFFRRCRPATSQQRCLSLKAGGGQLKVIQVVKFSVEVLEKKVKGGLHNCRLSDQVWVEVQIVDKHPANAQKSLFQNRVFLIVFSLKKKTQK